LAGLRSVAAIQLWKASTSWAAAGLEGSLKVPISRKTAAFTAADRSHIYTWSHFETT